MGNLLTKMFISSIIPAFSISGFSQSCCSGGVPISNNLGLPVSDAEKKRIMISSVIAVGIRGIISVKPRTGRNYF